MSLLQTPPIAFLRFPEVEAACLYELGMHIVVARESVPIGDLSVSSKARSLAEGHGSNLAAHAAELVQSTPGNGDGIAWYLVDSPENRARVVERRMKDRVRSPSHAANELLDRQAADEGLVRGITTPPLACGTTHFGLGPRRVRGITTPLACGTTLRLGPAKGARNDHPLLV